MVFLKPELVDYMVKSKELKYKEWSISSKKGYLLKLNNPNKTKPVFCGQPILYILK